MIPSTSLLRCAHCSAIGTFNLGEALRDRGDWVLRCPLCNAENVLDIHPDTTPPLEISGWRE